MSAYRVKLITFLFFSVLVVLLGRSLFLSLQSETYSAIPTSRVQIHPTRGLIYDASGIPLVENRRRYFYYFDCRFFLSVIEQNRVDKDLVLQQLERRFSVDLTHFLERLSVSHFILLGVYERDLGPIDRPLHHFISVDQRSARNILYPETADIVGRVDDYGGGLSGIELSMDTTLYPRGTGLIDFERMGAYQRVGRILDMQSSTDGEDVHLSISLNLQTILAQRIEEAKTEFQAKEASGIIIETHTGKVRAMYSTLGWNSVLMNIYEIGSAIKPLFFGMALKYSLLDSDHTYHCTGKIQPFSDLPYVISDTYAHGHLDIKEGLAHSCNTVTIEVAKTLLQEMGDWTIYHELQRLGFGTRTGIELPGEVAGILHRPTDWNRLTGVQMSIGYGLAMTQLQLAVAINTIANGGIYVSPTILEQRLNPINQRVVFQPHVVEMLIEMMTEVVDNGTGRLAQIKGLPVAGKTGTATKPIPGGYSRDKFISSFVGFFPADNPMYTILVSLDEPQGTLFYSSDIAAPVFQRIAQDVLDSLRSPLRLRPEPLVYKSWKMPSLIGLSFKDVLDLCADMGIDLTKVKAEGSGLVVRQFPPVDTPIEWVDQVIVHLGE